MYASLELKVHTARLGLDLDLEGRAEVARVAEDYDRPSE
jgi:hypothetical protein